MKGQQQGILEAVTLAHPGGMREHATPEACHTVIQWGVKDNVAPAPELALVRTEQASALNSHPKQALAPGYTFGAAQVGMCFAFEPRILAAVCHLAAPAIASL